jgi:hypothetical protein
MHRIKKSVYLRRLGWLTCRISLVLLVVTRVDALQHVSSSSRNAYRVSQEMLEGLQSSSKNTGTSSSSHLLDLETDFYDDSTGLYSEGVWHNCMAGIAGLHAHHVNRNQHLYDDAIRIADSLFRYSWDGTSFRRRTWSGNWDHSRLQLPDTDIVQANYYKESSEHRCISHAIAYIFFSILAQQDNDKDNAKDNYSKICSQQSLIAKKFVDEFWNGQRWTTISRTQGSGTLLRPSASSGAATRTTESSSSIEAPYYRAVDQALAVLACLQHLQLLDSKENESENKDERDRIIHLIQTTCNDLLDDKDGFGYNNLPNSQTYLGLNRNRNFWHEGFVMLALTSARDYIWPMDTQEGSLKILWNGLMERYTTTDTTTTTTTTTGKDNYTVSTTVWHWALSEKDIEYNVRYCGDNALAYAIRRNMQSKNNDNDDDSFWTFIDMLRSKNKSNDNMNQLASVADVYPQVRLHPNTELAALLVWPP